MSTAAFEFIPAQVRPQVANLLDQCLYCGGSGVEPTYDGIEFSHMSACHACNGEGLTVRTDAAAAVKALHDALAEVNTALDRTAWVDDVKPDSYANVRLSGKQIAAVRAAIAAAGTTPATDAHATNDMTQGATAANGAHIPGTAGSTPAPATNLTPSSLRATTSVKDSLEGRNGVSALDGANNSATGTTPGVECTLGRTPEEEREACFLGIQRAMRDCATYAQGSEAYVRALASLQQYQSLMIKACDGDTRVMHMAMAGQRAW